jgi:predicted TIM-barrel fold metal-dependent hydrolase
MKRLGVRKAILSCTAPGACVLDGQASYKLARELNLYAAELRDNYPEKFGFFANLPSLLDTEAALAELVFALHTLKADGVVIFTRYGHGNSYLGHPDIEPIWAELHKRKAVVFVHPTHPVDTTKVNPKLLQPMIDYPHETTRAAMDMIMMGTRQKYPDCKVVLSHAGGTLPYLISRSATPMRKAPNFAAYYVAGTTYEKEMQDFRSMYYDVALSSSPQVLDMLLRMVPHDHILYGVGKHLPFARKGFSMPTNIET